MHHARYALLGGRAPSILSFTPANFECRECMRTYSTRTIFLEKVSILFSITMFVCHVFCSIQATHIISYVRTSRSISLFRITNQERSVRTLSQSCMLASPQLFVLFCTTSMFACHVLCINKATKCV